MTDSEKIKGLECCQTEYQRNCKECPYEKYKSHSISAVTCSSQMRADLLDLVNGLKADKKRLQEELNKISWDYDELLVEKDDLFDEAEILVETAKTEAIKEFAERLKDEILFYSNIAEVFEFVDNLVKEMDGDANA